MADEESPDVAGPVSHTFDAISGLYDQYGDSKTGKAMGLAGSGVAAGAAIASGDPNQVAKTTVGIGAGAAGAGAVAAFTGPGVIAVVGGVAGLFLGWSYWRSTKTLPNGERVPSYDEASRKHGKQIFYAGVGFAVLYGILWVSQFWLFF